MLPLAFAAQRAPPPRRTHAKQTLQETSWPKLLKAKASVRTLKSKSSFASLTRRGTSQSSTGIQSPPSRAHASPTLGEAPPPVPRIPLRFVTGVAEASSEEVGSGEAIAPFLAFENYAPTKQAPTTPTTPKTPTTPITSNKMRNVRPLGSTTTLTSTATTPSFPSGPEDPFWDDAVARVKEKVRHEQEEERRERKASSKAERRFIRKVSKGREGHLKWAKLAIEALVGKYDEHGWLPKKDPKDFSDDDWNFVLEVLNHQDTKKLRDRLFQKPEWIEADKARKLRYEEAMRTNPTPEYLAAQKAQKDKERKEYGFRKILGLLTEEELERERLEGSPHVGLGISNVLEPATPTTFHTDKSSKATGRSSQSSGTPQTASRGRKRSDHGTPGSASLARRSVEQMTGVFNTDGFDPRLSRLGSEEIKQYIRDKSATRAEPLTPTLVRYRDVGSLDPHQSIQALSTEVQPSEITEAKAVDTNTNANSPSNIRAAAKAHVLRFGDFPPPTLPTSGIHPALRDSKIPRLRQVRSSITPASESIETVTGETRRLRPSAPLAVERRTPQQRPIQPCKPSSTIKTYSEYASFPSSPSSPAGTLPPPFSLGRDKPTSRATKIAPIIRKPSTAVNMTKSIRESAKNAEPVRQEAPSAGVTTNFEPAKSHRNISQQGKVGPSHNAEDNNVDNREWRSTLAPEFVYDGLELVDACHHNSNFTEQRRASSLPLFQSDPKSLARLSRIPTMPDASDFLAAMGEDPPQDMPRDTSSSSLTYTPSTPRERLTAKRRGIPVAFGSSVSASHSTVFGNRPIGSPTSSLPTFEVECVATENTTMSLQVSGSNSKVPVTGKWKLIPSATQRTMSTETSARIDQTALHRIEHVKDLTQLSSVTAPPAEPPQRDHGHTSAAESPDYDSRPDSSEVDVSFADVINAWQQSSPVPATQSHDASFNNQEIQMLRSEIGLEPIHEHIPGNAKHSNHHYTWNTKKIMCRQIHNPGIILPSLPSPTPGRPANMAEYATEFFVGNPYTNEPSKSECCAGCGSFCCRFAELSIRPQKRTTDIMELNGLRRNAEAVATLRATKPNGVEEWDAFLDCSQCQRAFCPDCIMLCSEKLCQEPVCSNCREGPELCRIHNMI
jgi:hypothetical protein